MLSGVLFSLYSILHWLLDSWRSPDLVLTSSKSEADTKYWISGYSSWNHPRSFDAAGRRNGRCIGHFFEVWPEHRAFYRRLPDIPSTEHYPASFGIVGTIRGKSTGGSCLRAWYRLTNLRALFFGSVMTLAALAAIIIVFLRNLPADSRSLLGMALLFSVAFLPLSTVSVVLLAGLISTREPVEELARYLARLTEDNGGAA